MLFHGTKTFNVLGILSTGLVVSPLEAPQTGNLYGSGIYLADKFEKSSQYCGSNINYYTNGNKKEYNYMFLCEAVLGKCLVLKSGNKTEMNSNKISKFYILFLTFNFLLIFRGI